MTVKITALPEAASILPTDLLVTVIDPGGSPVTKKITAANFGPQFHPLTTLLTSTSWDGDAFSTTAKTLIDLSAVFSAPAGIKAVSIIVKVTDSGSAGTDTYLILDPTNGAGVGASFSPMPVDSRRARYVATIPCDANGDIYYQVVASGAGTFTIILQINGYWI